MKRKRGEWFVRACACGRRPTWRVIARDAAGLILGTVLMLVVGLLGYQMGRESERVMLHLQGLCRLPPEVTDVRTISSQVDEGLRMLKVEKL